MKTTLSATAFSGLLMILSATCAALVAASPLQGGEPDAMWLAVGGGDQIQQHQERLYRNKQTQMPMQTSDEDEAQRFARTLEEQPTAAGPQEKPVDPSTKQRPAAMHGDNMNPSRGQYGQ